MKRSSLLLLPLLLVFIVGCKSRDGRTTVPPTSSDVTAQSGTSSNSASSISGNPSSQPSSSSSSEQVPSVTQPIVTSMTLANSRSNSSNLLNVNDAPMFDISIANPGEATIASISINGQIVNNSAVSTSNGVTRVICEVAGSSVEGSYEYRLTQVKYIDGETLKDASFISTISVSITYQVPLTSITFWNGYGAAFSSSINSLCEEELANKSISIRTESKGSYDNLQRSIMEAANTNSLPQFANGYSSHLAGYAQSNILVPLNDYISEYNSKYSCSLLDSYFESYLIENTTLKYDASGNSLVMGLPFNRSNEVLAYNSYFVDYAKSLSVISDIPKTWQEWATYGPSLRALQVEMCGKYLHGVVDQNGHASNFVLNTSSTGNDILLDMSDVSASQSALMSWDSLTYLFITLVEQWGGSYVRYTKEDAMNFGHGYVQFNSESTKNALSFINSLYGHPENYSSRVFTTPASLGGFYTSDAFSRGQVLFVGCSSGGISYNVNNYLAITSIPYFDDGENVRKYVTSQGTNLCLFDTGDQESKNKAFEAMVDFTTGNLQAKWAVSTGYFPVSSSARGNIIYQDFINSTPSDTTQKAYIDAARVNENEYMNSLKNWNIYCGSPFVGADLINYGVSRIIQDVLSYVGVGKDNTKTIQGILDEAYSNLSDYVLP